MEELAHPPTEFAEVRRQLTQGDPAAVASLYRCFAHRLIQLSDTRLAPWLRRRVEPNDILQTVFRTFLRRFQTAEWDFGDWDGLWRLLAEITRCKCAEKARFHSQQCRNANAEHVEPLDHQLVSREPSPEEVAMFNELFAYLLSELAPDRRAVIEAVLAGCTIGEAATKAGCSLRTANRVMAEAYEILERRAAQPPATN